MTIVAFEQRLPTSLINEIADLTELRFARQNYIAKQQGVYTKKVVNIVKQTDDSMRAASERIVMMGMRTGHDLINDKDLRLHAFTLGHEEMCRRHEERRRISAERKRAKNAREEENADD